MMKECLFSLRVFGLLLVAATVAAEVVGGGVEALARGPDARAVHSRSILL